ncbi:glucokinase [Legionella impletisoli]|uniref:Glucokinase n=1 Tax=Legionella impletisoli TaxID=343510 RepID=A0A917JNS0_9GAMM|nr:glucokinase [Legionella impletisoli]GGI75460.1 glucokinase [Legionella impletisoli]
MSDLVIVADIGGTNARFAAVDLETMHLSHLVVYSCAEFPSFEAVFSHYQHTVVGQPIKRAAIAVACPILGDEISMTNLHWQCSISALKVTLQLEELIVMNDFIAIAMSLPVIPRNETVQIGGGKTLPGKPKVILGPGTGLGVSFLISDSEKYTPLGSEGGHVGWCAETEQEHCIYRFLKRQFGRVSIERVLSGSGLEQIYLALAEYSNLSIAPLSASNIATLALQGDALAKTTVDQFFAILGSFAGDLALTLNAYGGVYLAGGMIPKLLPQLNALKFRERFEAKGRFSSVNQSIATFAITTKQPGLLGAALCLKQQGNYEYNTTNTMAATA